MKKKPLLCAVLAAGLLASLCVTPAFAAGEAWKEAYRGAIAESVDDWGNVFQLVDMDLDGIPELLVGGKPGSGLFSELQTAYTYLNGSAAEIRIQPDVMLGDSYTLYRNDSAGTYRIEGGYVLRAGAGYHTSVTAIYSYNGEMLSSKDTFGKGMEGSKEVYYIGGDATSASKYNSAYHARNDGWSKVGGFQYAELFVDEGKISSKEINAFLDSYKTGPVLAKASTHKIQVNGAPVDIGAYGIGGSNYFKLRDVAMLLKDTQGKFQVGFDDATKKITLTTGEGYTAVGGELAARDSVNRIGNPTASAIFVDGQAVDLMAYNINGNNYFKLRDLGSALGFAVTWDEASRTVNITTAK